MDSLLIHEPTSAVRRLPAWFQQKLPDIKKTEEMQRLLRDTRLHTVCQSACCPNLGSCWGQGVATFLILGDICTRACRFCNVRTGTPLETDVHEPRHVALAVQRLALRYAVITSVTRDDLPDKGADQFVETLREVHKIPRAVTVEVLIPDFQGQDDSLRAVVDAGPNVVGHNMETVRRLFPRIRPQAGYHRSLRVLKMAKKYHPDLVVKSGLMLGFGETKGEVLEVMEDLLSSGCDMLTIGQYLSPSSSDRHVRVERFVPPDEFEEYKRAGLAMGFKVVMSAPLVRSSFLAEYAYNEFLDHMRLKKRLGL